MMCPLCNDPRTDLIFDGAISYLRCAGCEGETANGAMMRLNLAVRAAREAMPILVEHMPPSEQKRAWFALVDKALKPPPHPKGGVDG